MKILMLAAFMIFTSGIYSQYRIYDFPNGNLYAQQLLPLKDGNLLLIAEIDCYTPGEVTIEGCHYALQLIKITTTGDTIWKSEFPFPGYSIRPFENSDGSFTFFSIERDISTCDGWGASPIFPAVGITAVSSTGQKGLHVQFPDECELNLHNVTRIDEDKFAVLATYSKWPFIDDYAEGQLMIVDKTGNILQITSEYGRNWGKGRIFYDGTDSLQLFYIDTSFHLNLKTFDFFLNEGSHLQNTTFQDDCISANKKTSPFKSAGGDFFVACYTKVADTSIQYFNRFDSLLQFKGEFSTRFSGPTNYISLINGEFLVASVIKNPITGVDVQIHHIDETGIILNTKSIEYEGDEIPRHLLRLPNDSLLLTGSLNCCNYADTTGPGKSFFLKEELLTTSIEIPGSNYFIQVYPNPASDYLTVKMDIPEKNDLFKINIIDQIGHLVATQILEHPSENIKISSLSQGIYFYEISVGNEPVFTGKFVKLSN